jgi:hypothetical protein
MAKKGIVSIVISLILLLAILQVNEVVEANPIPWPVTPNTQEKPTLTIETPQNYTTYGVDGVPLDFSLVQPSSWDVTYDFFFHIGEVTGLEVSVDGNFSSSYPFSPADNQTPLNPFPPTYYSIVLYNLTLGMHEVKVTVQAYSLYTTPISGRQNIPVNHTSLYQYPIVVSDIVYINIAPPKVLVLSPQTTTYNETSVSFVYSVNEATAQVYYSLDGQTNTTVPSNATLDYLSDEGYNASLFTTVLTDLSNGIHNVTVYATDLAGNISNQTISFIVEKPNTLLFELDIVAIAIPVAVICLIAGLLIYRRHRKPLD